MKFKANIDTAISTMEKNLADHVVELKEATTGWIEQVVKEMENVRDAINRDELKVATDKLTTLIYQKPQDTRQEYAKFIGALKITRDAGETHITMDEREYDFMFNDNWEWRSASKFANASYTARRR